MLIYLFLHPTDLKQVCGYRLDDAIKLLGHVVGVREEKLGTANPVTEDEKRRLAQLLKEAGNVTGRKAKSLKTLIDSDLTSSSALR